MGGDWRCGTDINDLQDRGITYVERKDPLVFNCSALYVFLRGRLLAGRPPFIKENRPGKILMFFVLVAVAFCCH